MRILVRRTRAERIGPPSPCNLVVVGSCDHSRRIELIGMHVISERGSTRTERRDRSSLKPNGLRFLSNFELALERHSKFRGHVKPHRRALWPEPAVLRVSVDNILRNCRAFPAAPPLAVLSNTHHAEVLRGNAFTSCAQYDNRASS